MTFAAAILVLCSVSPVFANTSGTNKNTGYKLVIEDDADFFTADEEADLTEMMKQKPILLPAWDPLFLPEE